MPSSTSGIVINEIQIGSNLAAFGLDANNDGMFDGNDNSVEIYNNGASSVDLAGWELWYTVNNVGAAVKIATLNAFTLAPGGHFTIVESSSAFVDLSNVGDGQEASTGITPNLGSTYGLYNPGLNEYVLLAGPSAVASQLTTPNAITAAHPGATKSGATEEYPFYFVNGGLATVQRETDASDTWETNPATLGSANCFAQGTRIKTPEGESLIQTLQVGDLVTTADGRDVQVLWIGRQTIQKRFWRERAQLVRIAAGTLGNHSDLLVTGDHGMVTDGNIINASALVNGSTIDWVLLMETPERQTVYHIETEAHDVIIANGAASETFVDTAGRATFDNHQEYLDLYGAERNIPESVLTRISSGRLVSQEIQDRLLKAEIPKGTEVA